MVAPSSDRFLRTRIVFGNDAVERLGALASELGATRVLLVTDEHIVQAGHAPRAERSLREAGLEVRVHAEVRENPTTRDVERCLEAARDFEPDLIVGIGGGSSIDTAKGCNFLLTNGGRMEDYWGIGKAPHPMLPLIAIPTTAGTGTETQSFALIAQEGSHQKMACGDPKAAARIAILDPTLTVSQPRFVTACTGMDTVTHAVETAVTKKRNAVSSIYSREAFALAAENLPRVLDRPDDLEARGRMLRAASFAGIAIENSMLGAAHALANPLTAHHDIAHGHAVGLMLPHVVRFNAEEDTIAEIYAGLAQAAGLTGVEELVKRLEHLLRKAELPATLRECGVPVESLDLLAAEAARQWTAQFNPREVTSKELRALYERAMD